MDHTTVSLSTSVSRPALLNRARFRIAVPARSPVENQRDRLDGPIAACEHEKSVSAWSDDVLLSRDGAYTCHVGREQAHRCADTGAVGRSADRHGHQVLIGRDVEQFLSVSAPAHLGQSVGIFAPLPDSTRTGSMAPVPSIRMTAKAVPSSRGVELKRMAGTSGDHIGICHPPRQPREPGESGMQVANPCDSNGVVQRRECTPEHDRVDSRRVRRTTGLDRCRRNPAGVRRMIDAHTRHAAAAGLLVFGLSIAIDGAQQPAPPLPPVVVPVPPILQNYRSVSNERLKRPDDGDWLMIRRTYDGWGYSPLDQIAPGQRRAAAAGVGVLHRRRSTATRRRRSSTTA